MITAYKKIGETPLDVIKKLKAENPKLKDEKMAYAGRLDPMAEGLLLILTGEECKKRNHFELLSKEYKFEILLGISTDSYDLLGKILKIKQPDNGIDKQVEELLPSMVGKTEQAYPPFSSARVNGKSLYYWARAGKLSSIKIPKKIIEIFSLELNGVRAVSKDKISSDILGKLSKIRGEFRQEEIIKDWKDYFSSSNIQDYKIASLTVSCTSGTYVRSISNNIGRKLGCGALAYSIKRTSIGNYKSL